MTGQIVEGSVGGQFGRSPATVGIYSSSTECGAFNRGNVSSWKGELGLTPIKRFASLGLFDLDVSLGLSLSFGPATTTFSTLTDSSLFLYDTELGSPRRLDVEYQLRIAQQIVEPFARLNFRMRDVPQLSFGLSGMIGVPLSSDVEQTQRLISDDNVSFSDGQTVRVMTEGPVYTNRTVQIGGMISATYAIPLSRISPALSLIPLGGVRIDFNAPVNEVNWRTLSVFGQLGLQYDFSPKPPDLDPPLLNAPAEPVIPPVPPTQAVEPVVDNPGPLPTKRLQASIDVFTLENDIRQNQINVQFHEFNRTRLVKPNRRFKFEPGKETLPAMYNDRSRRVLPTFDSLLGLSPEELQRSLIDLVGIRLQNNPDWNVELVPAESAGRSGITRAGHISEYLNRHWSISQARISIGDGDPGLEKSVVEIRSNAPDLMAPLVTQRFERDFDSPRLKLNTSQEAEAGVKAWEITLSNDDEEIARYSSIQPEGTGNRGIDWNVLYRDRTIDTSTITAVYMIEDSTGARAIARSSADLIVRKNRVNTGILVDLESGREIQVIPLKTSGDRIADSLLYSAVSESMLHGLEPDATVLLIGEKGVFTPLTTITTTSRTELIHLSEPDEDVRTWLTEFERLAPGQVSVANAPTIVVVRKLE